jgi:plasmid maintenance system antidote protein VapI
MCDTCPVRRQTEDQIAEDNTSDEFAGFIRSAMQSFGIDPDAWLEEQDRLDLERAEEA